MLQPITTSTYSFPDVIGNGFVYVDKTAIIRELLRDGKNQYFCARPRRFGKSLLISTLQSIFEGRRELFKGLAIDTSDYDWKTYPVMRLDMGSCQADDEDELRMLLNGKLDQVVRQLEIDEPPLPKSENGRDPVALRFENVCQAAAKKSPQEKMVILVDEYDKPLLGKLGTPEVTEIKNLLKKFYGVIKSCESYQRLAFMTGVSKFSKVSIFSDLNNLTDITMDARYATLFGYTREEVLANFPEHIAALAEAQGLTPEGAFAKLEEMYDGFRFEENAERVFNPVSVGKCLSQLKFGNYWFETGTPTFLVDMLKRNPIGEGEMTVTTSDLSSAYEPEQVWLLPLMVQTGYLTIKSAQTQGRETVCELGYPNLEVEGAMSKHLVQGLSCARQEEFSPICNRIYAGLYAGEVDEVLEGIRCFFENIPYDLHLKYEKYYQSLFVSVFQMLKARVSSEVKTARGRIDAVVETPDYIYLFEFKLRGTSEEAMAQIETMGYAAKYASDPRKLFKIGCAFDWDARNLGKWIVG